jgi:hypothetical protein
VVVEEDADVDSVGSVVTVDDELVGDVAPVDSDVPAAGPALEVGTVVPPEVAAAVVPAAGTRDSWTAWSTVLRSVVRPGTG